ncbi:hypothetical protein [Amycolatopsis sp. NPDC049159]|uniref:hypothetical protein n=1 Tax=Amycolatopsis sp. NPDC049159 TaxID=3157210 RepID=UPI0033C19F39
MAPATSEPALPEPAAREYSVDLAGSPRRRSGSAGGSSYRVDRTSMSTKSGKVVPQATVTAVSCRKP